MVNILAMILSKCVSLVNHTRKTIHHLPSSYILKQAFRCRLINYVWPFIGHQAFKGWYLLNKNCIKCVRIRSYSGPHFPGFELNISPYLFVFSPNAGITDQNNQNNSRNGNFSRSEILQIIEVPWGIYFFRVVINA